MVGLEFSTVFIERDSMTEVADRSIGGCKWQGMRHYPDRANRIPTPSIKYQAHVLRPGWERSIPYADKFYLNIHREGLLKCVALIPPSRVLASEHLVCEGNLLVVPRREQAHL
jgi:hypothetical protein